MYIDKRSTIFTSTVSLFDPSCTLLKSTLSFKVLVIVDKGGRNRDFSQLGGELRGTANAKSSLVKETR